MLYKIIWFLFGNGLAKFHSKTQNKTIGLHSLEYRFMDSNGVKYYGFPSTDLISVDRFKHLENYINYMANGLTPKRLDEICDNMDKLILEGLERRSKGKHMNVSELGANVYEIRTSKEMIIPSELIYNVICVQLVREDETPGVYNHKIHMEKVAQCKKELDNENSFFLSTLEKARYMGLSVMSEEQFKTYLMTSDKIASQYNNKFRSLLSKGR